MSPESNFDTDAFPTLPDAFPGMSLRDWFAGQALAGKGGWDTNPAAHTRHKSLDDHIARAAYALADAMLRAREVR